MGGAPVTAIDLKTYINMMQASATSKLQSYSNKILTAQFYQSLEESITLPQKLKIQEDIRNIRSAEILQLVILKANYFRDQIDYIIQKNISLDLGKCMWFFAEAMEKYQLQPTQFIQFLRQHNIIVDEKLKKLFEYEVTDQQLQNQQSKFKEQVSPNVEVQIEDDLKEEKFNDTY
ncbi:Conserved_hypothetical protein [Hexamita inflata]|uniref:Uncharacterized protein n=1 Tax=Hexamita inflata TaxID=28002 RepID=A0ABP1GSI8_9EUKA